MAKKIEIVWWKYNENREMETICEHLDDVVDMVEYIYRNRLKDEDIFLLHEVEVDEKEGLNE